MKLYIANCSQQVHIIQARVPEINRIVSQPIEPGSQIAFGGDRLNSAQITAVIDQQRKYGMMEADEVSRLNAKVPLVFSRDRPVSLGVIQSCIQRNRGILTKQGEELRKHAAIAADKSATEALIRQPDLKSNLDVMELSVQEDTPGTIERDGGTPTNEGIRIQHGPNEPGRAPTNTKRKKRAA